jgi:hypothetical protein
MESGAESLQMIFAQASIQRDASKNAYGCSQWPSDGNPQKQSAMELKLLSFGHRRTRLVAEIALIANLATYLATIGEGRQVARTSQSRVYLEWLAPI